VKGIDFINPFWVPEDIIIKLAGPGVLTIKIINIHKGKNSLSNSIKIFFLFIYIS
jgi:hypothetical protein